MITPHFPPDSSAGTHRVRLLAPHMATHGWDPTVLTVHPAFIEGLQDLRLAALVPSNLRIERATAFTASSSRSIGIGDLGLRSLRGLYKRAAELLTDETYDAVYITIYPAYTALLGPILKKKFRIPFVLDYQDPWVGAWGKTVGGGRDGTPDFKSRVSRSIAAVLEPRVVRSADAMTAVSEKTMDGIVERIPEAARIPRVTIPIGGDQRDFDVVSAFPPDSLFFDCNDGLFHLCHVGTILPLGTDTLRALLGAVAALRDDRPDLYKQLRLHFLGSSNERVADAPSKVTALANDIGVADIVSEHPQRVDYTDAIQAQLNASALLLLGSSEHHYTASRLYPALLANRPLLAAYHRLSSVSSILGDGSANVHLIQFGDDDTPSAHVADMTEALISLIERRTPHRTAAANRLDESLSAHSLAGVLAGVLDKVVESRPH